MDRHRRRGSARGRRLGRARRAGALNRGDVFDAELPAGRHPVVVVTRAVAVPYRRSVVVGLVTSTARGIPTEVPVGPQEGLDHDCVVSCDNLFTVRKVTLTRQRGSLGPAAMRRLDDALRISLGLG